jgi:hypothetical protein
VTFALSAAVQACALPFIRLAQTEQVDTDFTTTRPAELEGTAEARPQSQ